MIAIVANVLNSEVFNSDGSKSSTKSLSVDLSSREKLLFISFNSIADFEFEYFSFNSFIAWFIEFISVFIISERIFFVMGLPLRYKIASTLVTISMSGNFLVIGLT